MNASGWFRALWRNRFAVAPSRLPMACIFTVASPVNSGLALLQSLVHGRRVASTPLVDDPIFVLGHWRSGTTLLHELLVCDPRHTSPDTYTCFAPNHFLLTERLFTKFLWVFLPSKRPMDDMGIRWGYPQEDEFAIANMGVPTPYLTLLFPNRPPSHPEYVDLRDLTEDARERWKRKLLWFLKCLTVRDSKRVVLKTPLHTCRVRTLLEVFPNARFVHITRDPFVIFPSMIHTWKQLYRYQGVQAPRFAGLDEYVLSTFQRMYQRFEEDLPSIGPGRFCEVRYEDLVCDPVGEMERVYQQLQLDGFEQARAAMAERAARSTGYRTNRYDISEEARRAISERWADYIRKYGPWASET